jgi:AcrR family transcriptional regulator
MNVDPYRQRILDAAVAVLAELGPTPRLLSAIADRAGVSRPTLYKYVGDKGAVFDALLERELERLFDLIIPKVEAITSPVDDYLDIAVLAERWAREHPVLQIVLDNHPRIVMRHIGNVLPTVLRIGTQRLGPIVDAAIAEGRVPALDLRDLLVWTTRALASLILMPDGEHSDQERRQSLARLLGLGAIAMGTSAG